ncbi:hypothetical protein RUR49_23675 [Pseudoxanthobacter sp. M-2]|uniref:hypothetical protein n=1 Tax=Pseudoxanthobacter sp. M-2 TaxID=3078754 RepID=UPI0038FD3905
MVRRRHPGLAAAAWLGAATVSLCMAVAGCQAMTAHPDDRIAPPIAACRAEDEVGAPNPNAPGGWNLVRSGSIDVLCLTGTLEAVRVADVAAALRRRPGSLAIVVRSTGGPVPVWLGLAEHLVGRVGLLVVDDACMSSCANYMVPLADTVLATPDSLVVWHGGPVGSVGAIERQGIDDIGTIVAYDELARRTDALYGRLGLDTAILEVSAEPPEGGKLRRTIAALGRQHDAPRTVGGYAFAPARLARCFGFRNVERMWHAGDDVAVARLTGQRVPGLIILESPGDRSAPAGGPRPTC